MICQSTFVVPYTTSAQESDSQSSGGHPLQDERPANTNTNAGRNLTQKEDCEDEPPGFVDSSSDDELGTNTKNII